MSRQPEKRGWTPTPGGGEEAAALAHLRKGCHLTRGPETSRMATVLPSARRELTRGDSTVRALGGKNH